MTATSVSTPGPLSRLANGLLSIDPLAQWLKRQARKTIVKRAESMGVPWTATSQALQTRDWAAEFAAIEQPELDYPSYYLQPFHAYETGNLNWQAACEVEVAALSVHARIWPEAGLQGDAKLRQSYHDVLRSHLPQVPGAIADMGCGVGLSTFPLQEIYPNAEIAGIDLSPHFLAVANYRDLERHRCSTVRWLHAAAEATGLPDQSFDLVSLFLICHELPQVATLTIFRESRRLLRPGGHLAVMDMNPRSEAFAKMPPYVFTLLKSTEPYMDEYFSLDLAETMVKAGFETPTIAFNSPRHRTAIAAVAD